MLDLAISFGCHPRQLSSMFSMRELQTLITHQLIKNGCTFDKEKIAELQHQKEKLRHQQFKDRAKQHWDKQHGN